MKRCSNDIGKTFHEAKNMRELKCRQYFCVALLFFLGACSTPQNVLQNSQPTESYEVNEAKCIAESGGYVTRPGGNGPKDVKAFQECMQRPTQVKALENSPTGAANDSPDWTGALRLLSCASGNKQHCEDYKKPVETKCVRDIFGNFKCISQ
jgi:hypothetical protein